MLVLPASIASSMAHSPEKDIGSGQHAGAPEAFVEQKRAILVDAFEHAGPLLRRKPRPDARTKACGPRQPSLADGAKPLRAPNLIPFRKAGRERGQRILGARRLDTQIGKRGCGKFGAVRMVRQIHADADGKRLWGPVDG